MRARKIFDAHHHLWKLDHCHYPWLMAKGVKRFFGDPAPIQHDYLVNDLLRDAAEFEIAGSTHVQVGVQEEDAVRETEWLQTVADQEGLPSAIVAFVDLTRDDVEDILGAHAQSSCFRGVRQIVGRHPGEDEETGTGDLLKHPNFLRGLKLLESRNYTFDLQLTSAHYVSARRLFEQRPDLKIVICHFASPWDLSLDGFNSWCGAMKEYAAMPNCSLKFSGFGMFKPDWTVKDIAPYIESALELFGEDRCMAGSNFPVDKLYGGFHRIWRALDAVIPEENLFKKITLENGAKFYDVSLAN